MTFASVLYAVFMLSVLGIYWAVELQSFRLLVLVAASLVFYSSLQVEYVPLLLGLTGTNFCLGLVISSPIDWRKQTDEEDWQFTQQDWNRRRFYFLCLGIVLNIGLLFSFKYIPFFLESAGTLFQWSQGSQQADWVAQHLVVPLGISFFCFENIAYLVDVYRGAPATRRFLEFAAYKLFFPKLISGPITRFHGFIGNLSAVRLPQLEEVTEGLWLIAAGAIKKVLLADRISLLVNLSFDNLERAGSGDLWLATFAYGLQLYLDFSGYVDMALGSAMLLGIKLPPNFNSPYFCTNIADFWRRWHMTLGEWLRNYLYFPLGGSRRGLGRTCLNLMIVMAIAGIWHGAAWGFVIWGLLHGLALVAHRLTDALSQKVPWLSRTWKTLPGILFAWALTQWMVFSSWIFFRLPDLKDSGWVVRHLWGHAGDVQFAQKVYVEALGLGRLQLAIVLSLIFGVMGLSYSLKQGLKLQLNWPVKLLFVPVFFFLTWLFAPGDSTPYIYFDF